MCGSTTEIVAAAATIASMALPPSRNTAVADCAASECEATAMPRRAKLVLIIAFPGRMARKTGCSGFAAARASALV